jgi:mono/diheme cytochrome c family protein
MIRQFDQKAQPGLDRLLLTVAAAIVLLSLLLLFLAAAEPSRLRQAADAAQGGAIEQGALLYSLHCRSCHGHKGEGVGQLGPALADVSFFTGRLAEVGWQTSLKEYVMSAIEYGRMMGTRPIYAGNGSTAVMAPWHQRYGGPLRSDEVENLTSFILNWERTADGTVQLEPLALPETNFQDPRVIGRGKMVFKQHCGGCHLSDTSGRAESIGPDLSRIAVSGGERKEGMSARDYIRESVLMPAATVVDGYDGIGSDAECGAILTISELDAVSAFLLR